MAVDAYQPCPCGSGKKSKFCCLKIADEMVKVQRLQDNRQFHAALQAVERVDREHPGHPWAEIVRASLLLSEGRAAEALDGLRKLLEREPEHPIALAMLASALLQFQGLAAAKPAIYRAYQRCWESHPEAIAGLALSIASLMLRDGRSIACRQHLALAMRLVQGQDQQEVFVRLLEFDSDASVPYPLRSVHHLAEDRGGPEHQREFRKGLKLAEIGCYEAAARVFTRLAEQEPQRAELWHNTGLCRAWDGDEPKAAEALHEAARRHADFETAVECETLAQLLDQENSGARVAATSHRYDVTSVGRLLSRLDEHPRLGRLPLTSPSPEEADAGAPAAVYNLLDRPAAEGPLTLETVPNVIGQVMVVDENRAQDRPAFAHVVSFEGELDEAARLLFEEAADSDARSNPEPAGEDEPLEGLSREAFLLTRRWHFELGTPVVERRRLEREQWERVVREIWPQMPLDALGGKTPREAAGDPQLRLPLAGALYVLDAFSERNHYSLDLPAVARDLQLPEPHVIEVTDQLPLATFSAMQLHRLPVRSLSDAQLNYALNRALLIHHSRFLYDVLNEVLARPSCAAKVDLDRVYQTLSQLARDCGRREEAFQWIAKGREQAHDAEKSFEATLKWTMHELSVRLEDPRDPELRPLLQHVVQYYLPKLPRLAEYLDELLATFGVEFDLHALGAEPAGSVTAGGVWTPESAQSGGGASKKLWLPGQ